MSSNQVQRRSDLFAYNDRCPECGAEITNHDIRAVETGLSYCSSHCANVHVKKVWPEIQRRERNEKKAAKIAGSLIEQGFDVEAFCKGLEQMAKAWRECY